MGGSLSGQAVTSEWADTELKPFCGGGSFPLTSPEPSIIPTKQSQETVSCSGLLLIPDNSFRTQT